MRATQGTMVAPQGEVAMPVDQPAPQNRESETRFPPYYQSMGGLPVNQSVELPKTIKLTKKLYSIKRVK